MGHNPGAKMLRETILEKEIIYSLSQMDMFLKGKMTF